MCLVQGAAPNAHRITHLSAQCAGPASSARNRFAEAGAAGTHTCSCRLGVFSAGLARRPPGGSDWRAGGAPGNRPAPGGGWRVVHWRRSPRPPPPLPTPTVALPTSPASLTTCPATPTPHSHTQGSATPLFIFPSPQPHHCIVPGTGRGLVDGRSGCGNGDTARPTAALWEGGTDGAGPRGGCAHPRPAAAVLSLSHFPHPGTAAGGCRCGLHGGMQICPGARHPAPAAAHPLTAASSSCTGS